MTITSLLEQFCNQWTNARLVMRRHQRGKFQTEILPAAGASGLTCMVPDGVGVADAG